MKKVILLVLLLGTSTLVVGCPGNDTTATAPAATPTPAPITPFTAPTADKSWERVNFIEEYGYGIYRTRTPTGWLVVTKSSYDGSKRLMFVPDSQHRWQTGKPEPDIKRAAEHAARLQASSEAFIKLIDEDKVDWEQVTQFLKENDKAWKLQMKTLSEALPDKEAQK